MSPDRLKDSSLALSRGLSVLSGLAVLGVLFQFVTAGRLFSADAPEELHAGGAIVLHVITGLAAIVAVLLARVDRARFATAVLAVVVFVATFVQAALGGRDSLALHIPGAMILTGGVVWLLVDALRGQQA